MFQDMKGCVQLQHKIDHKVSLAGFEESVKM